MGFFSGIRKRIKKIIPKEIRPFVPYLAAGMIPGGALGLGNLAPWMQKAIIAGGTRGLTDDEADLKDIGITAALAGAPAGLEQYGGSGMMGADYAKQASDYLGKQAAWKIMGAQGAVDAGIKQAELNEDALERYNRELLEQGIADKAGRRSAIRKIYEGTGTWDMDEVDEMLDTYGYRTGGRVPYAAGDMVTADSAEVISKVPQAQLNQIQGNQMAEEAYQQIFQKFMERFPGLATGEETIEEMIAMLQAEEVMDTPGLGLLGTDAAMDMITPESAGASTRRIMMGDTQWGDFTDVEEKRNGGRIGYQGGIGPNQGSPSLMAEAITDTEVEDAYGVSLSDDALEQNIKEMVEQSDSGEHFPSTDADFLALKIISNKHKVDLEVVIQIAQRINSMRPRQQLADRYASAQEGEISGRIGLDGGGMPWEKRSSFKIKKKKKGKGKKVLDKKTGKWMFRNKGEDYETFTDSLDYAKQGLDRLEEETIKPLPIRELRLASGGDVDDEVMEFDEEIITPDYLMKEEGVNIGEQVSSPGVSDSLNELSLELFGKPIFELTPDQFDMLRDEAERLRQKFASAYSQDEMDMYEQYKYDMNEQMPGMPIMSIDEFLQMELGAARAGVASGGLMDLNPSDDVEVMDAEEILTPDYLMKEEGVAIGPMAGGGDRGWRAQMLAEKLAEEQYGKEFYDLSQDKQMEIYTIALDMIDSGGMKKGGKVIKFRPKEIKVFGKSKDYPGIKEIIRRSKLRDKQRSGKAEGGLMNLGGNEMDLRGGGFVPLGAKERADDVPARLSKNEFVMTADAVRGAGGGSVQQGADLMYNQMKQLEARG